MGTAHSVRNRGYQHGNRTPNIVSMYQMRLRLSMSVLALGLASLLVLTGCSGNSSPAAIAEPTSPPPPSLDFPVAVLPDDLADFPLPPGTTLSGSDIGATDSAYWNSTSDFPSSVAYYATGTHGSWTFTRLVGLLNTADFTAKRDGVTFGQLAIASGTPVHISLRRGAASLPSTGASSPLPTATPLNFPPPSAVPTGLSKALQPTGGATYVGGTAIGGFIYAIWESTKSIATVVGEYKAQLAAANVAFEISTTPSGTGFVLKDARIIIIPITTGSRISIQAQGAP